jgi:hypothetical protein
MIYCLPPSTYSDTICSALQRHCTEKLKLVFREMKLRGIHKSDHVCSVYSKILPSSLAVFSHPLFALYSTIIPNILCHPLALFSNIITIITHSTVFCHSFALYVFCHPHFQYSDIFSRCIYHVSFHHNILSSVCT